MLYLDYLITHYTHASQKCKIQPFVVSLIYPYIDITKNGMFRWEKRNQMRPEATDIYFAVPTPQGCNIVKFSNLKKKIKKHHTNIKILDLFGGSHKFQIQKDLQGMKDICACTLYDSGFHQFHIRCIFVRDDLTFTVL